MGLGTASIQSHLKRTQTQLTNKLRTSNSVCPQDSQMTFSRMFIRKVRVRPFGQRLSENETETKTSIESVGEYLLILHTRRYDGGMLVHLLDGPGYLCQDLRNNPKETINAVMIQKCSPIQVSKSSNLFPSSSGVMIPKEQARENCKISATCSGSIANSGDSGIFFVIAVAFYLLE